MNLNDQTDADYVAQIDELLSHVWMIRAFLKHCEEAEEDDELRDVQRTLYDYMLALGAPLQAGDHSKYLKQAKKKLKKLKAANELFQEIQPEISSHTNFQMAAVSLDLAVTQVAKLVEPMQKNSAGKELVAQTRLATLKAIFASHVLNFRGIRAVRSFQAIRSLKLGDLARLLGRAKAICLPAKWKLWKSNQAGR